MGFKLLLGVIFHQGRQMSDADQFSSFMSEMKRRKVRQEKVDNEREGLTSHPHPPGHIYEKDNDTNLHVKAVIWLGLVR